MLTLLQNGKDTEVLGDSAFVNGMYEQALQYYYEAYDSPNAFMKRARVLSVLRTQGLVCEYDAYLDVILEFLSWALEQDSNLLPIIVRDTLLEEVTHTVLFNIWRGYSVERGSSLAALLPKVHWYTYPETITAINGQLVFQDDGSVYVHWGTYYEYDEETEKLTAYPQGEETGQFTVVAKQIRIVWQDGSASRYRLERRGTCGVLIDVGTGEDVFFDHPDECNT